MATLGELLVQLGVKGDGEYHRVMKGVAKRAMETETNFGTLTGQFIKANLATQALNKAMEALGKVLSTPFAVGTKLTDKFAELKSISPLIASDFKDLKEAAEKMGATTMFTATQATEGMINLRRAGFEVNEILEITPQVLALSAAQGADFASVSESIGLQLKNFAEQGVTAKDVADRLNQTVSSSAQGFEHLAEALPRAGAIAATVGVSFDDMTTLLAQMADAGFRGELAGRAFAAGLSNLAGLSKNAIKALNSIGLNALDVNINMNSLRGVIDNLNKAMLDVEDPTRRLDILIDIFGKDHGPKFAKAVLGGADAFDQYGKKISEANKATDSAIERQDSLRSDLTKMNSAWEDLGKKLFNYTENILRNSTQALTENIQKRADALSQWQKESEVAEEAEKAYNLYQNAIDRMIDAGGDEIEIRLENNKTYLDFVRAIIKSREETEEFNRKKKEEIKLTEDATKKKKKEKEIEENKAKAKAKALEILTNANNVLKESEKEAFNQASKSAQDYLMIIESELIGTKAELTYQQKLLILQNLELAESIEKANKNTRESSDYWQQYLEVSREAKKETDKKIDSINKLKEAQEALRDVGIKTVETFGGNFTGIGSAVSTFKSTGDGIAAGLAFLTDAMMSTEAMQRISSKINEKLAQILEPYVAAAEPFFDAMIPLMDQLKGPIKIMADVLRARLAPATTALNILSKAISTLENAFKPFSQDFQNIFESHEKHFQGILDGFVKDLKELFEKLFKKVKQAVEDPLGWIRGTTKGNEGLTALNPYAGFQAGIAGIKFGRRGSVFNPSKNINVPGQKPAPLSAPQAMFGAFTDLLGGTGDLMSRFMFKGKHRGEFDVGLYKEIDTLGKEIERIFSEIDISQLSAEDLSFMESSRNTVQDFLSDASADIAQFREFMGMVNESVGGGDTSMHDSEIKKAFNIVINSIDPRAQAEELRQLLEEMGIADRFSGNRVFGNWID